MLSISLGDILKALDQFKAWPRIQAAPDRIDALEKRIAALEAARALPPPKPAEACPFCEGGLRLTDERPARHFGVFGVMQRTYRCDACERDIERQHDPRKE